MIKPNSIRQAHRILAIGLAVYILLHLSVHLTAIWGVEQHNRSLKAVQWIYRNPVVEPVLMLAILVQAITGLNLVARLWRLPNKGFWRWTQIASGLFLMWFMLQHSVAALVSRHFIGLETNFYWASGPLHHPMLKIAFIPYYFLLSFCVFAHIAAFVYFRRRRKAKLSIGIFVTGAFVSGLIVATFSGAFFPITVPENYAKAYDSIAKGTWPNPATTH